MTKPSYISIARIALIFPIIFLSSFQNPISNFFSLFLFLIASFSDFIDGYLARKTQSESELGSLLDLIADKLLVCIVLIWISYLNNSIIILIPVLLIVSREMAISSIRQFFSEYKDKALIKVSSVGKLKTTLQMISISMLLISPEMGKIFYDTSIVLLWFSAFFSIFSLYVYLSSWFKAWISKCLLAVMIVYLSAECMIAFLNMSESLLME